MNDEKKVLSFLEKNNITYILHKHAPVFTCDEAQRECAHIDGLDCKNLVLRDHKKNIYLVVLPVEEKINMKDFAKIIGVKKMSFASPEILNQKLHVDPGSVSVLGLINNHDSDIQVYLHQSLQEADILTFHPNSNDMTIQLTQRMFQIFLSSIDHVVHRFM